MPTVAGLAEAATGAGVRQYGPASETTAGGPMETSPGRTRRSGGHARSGPLLRTRDAESPPPRHRAPVATPGEGIRGRAGRVSPVRLGAGAAAAAVVLAGAATLLLGGDDAPVTPPAAPPRAAASSPTPAADAQRPADAEPSAAVVAATAADRTPADARAALEELLAARAEANLALLGSAWEGDQPAAARAGRALAASTQGMSDVVSAWRDTALAAELSAGLDRQSEASRAYAAAVSAGDVDAADRARAAMGQVSRELGAVLARVTGGRIADYVPPQDAAQYRAFVDALEAEDDGAAREVADWLRARLAREGAALAQVLSGGGPS